LTVQDLPHLNATLNAVATVLLLAGFTFIRMNRVRPHMVCMLTSVLVSAAFLASYLIYHYHVGSVKYTGQGLARGFYFFVLITHVVLAAIVPIFVSITLYFAARRRFDRHKRIARITFPIWLYVSITGVIVYWMLYQA